MALFTSHILNAVDGSHAGGIGLRLYRIDPAGHRRQVLETQSDEGGRIEQEIDLSPEDLACRFEMVLAGGAFFAEMNLPAQGQAIVDEIVIRFAMPDTNRRYHIPVILAPNSYSVWWSG